jgi:hypothetical protein
LIIKNHRRLVFTKPYCTGFEQGYHHEAQQADR